MSTSKTLTIGAVALVVAGLGGFAATHFMRQRVVADVESQFATLSTVFAKAEHGPIDYDLWNRTLEIKQITLLPKDAAPDAATTIASVKAFGASARDGGFAAERLEIRELATTSTWSPELAPAAKYQVPLIAAEIFAMRPLAPAGASNDPFGNLARIFDAISAKAVSIETMKSTTTAPAVNKAGPAPFAGNIEQAQHDVRIENLRDGRIAKASVGRLTMSGKMQPPVGGDLAIEARDGYVTDYDLVGLLAAVAPEGAIKRPAGQTVLWQTAGVGPMSIKVGNQVNVAIAGATMDKVAVDAAKLRPAWTAFKASQPAAGRPLPGQQQAFAKATADLYESISFGKFEYRDMTIEAAGNPPFKIATIAMDDYRAGRLGIFTIAGFDTTSPKKEIAHLGRFALTGLKLPHILRMSGQMTPATMLRPAQMYLDILRALDGFEISDLRVPEPKTGQLIHLETAKANWGAVVGQLPTVGDFSFKGSMPISAGDKDPFAVLARAGMHTAKMSYDGKWSWQEASQTLAQNLDFEFADVVAASARFDLTNVTRKALMAGPDALKLAAADIRLGPATVNVRDLGAIKLAENDAAIGIQRLQILQTLKSPEPPLPPDSIEVAAIKAGIAKFVETAGQMLTIEFVPKSQATLGQMMAVGKTTPEQATFLGSAFDVRVTTGPAK